MEKLTASMILLAAVLFMISCNPDAAKKTKSETSDDVKKTEPLCWKDIRAGELPPVGAYDAIDSLVKKWDLCYERIETGCVITDSTRKIQKEADRTNEVYFKSLEKKLGKNWKQQFDKELHLSDSINWIKISEQMRRMNK